MALLLQLFETLVGTIGDVVPVLALFLGFQRFILRQPLPHAKRIAFGFVMVVIGLACFLVGLEKALFPVGKLMARQLSDPAFVFGAEWGGAMTDHPPWEAYGWIYLFAAAVGFSTTLAEPSLLAVAMKAHEVSRGQINAWALRIAVAFGVALGLALGAFRIVTGLSLVWFIVAGYIVVVAQTVRAPKMIIPLAYDSGGVTTSTVTVPLVAALGLGLAETIPGRNPALDGFGLIAFASLFPMMTVMGYAQWVEWRSGRAMREK